MGSYHVPIKMRLRSWLSGSALALVLGCGACREIGTPKDKRTKVTPAGPSGGVSRADDTDPKDGFMVWCEDKSAPDEVRRTVAALLDVLGTRDCKAADEKAQTTTTLSLDRRNLANLGPLGTFTALTALDLNGNRISDLGALSSLRKLVSLNLSNNPVSQLAPLSGLPALESLFVEHAKVTDVGTLAPLPALKALYLSGNTIADLKGLSPFAAKLQKLRLTQNKIVDLKPLRGFTALVVLELDSNLIQDFEPLSDLKSLETLYLKGNPASAKTTACPVKKSGIQCYFQ